MLDSFPISAETILPNSLEAQIKNLVTLLSDGHATGNPDATQVYDFQLNKYQDITLVLFVVSGFGGGNSGSQYLAVFEKELLDNGIRYFRLIDCKVVGGALNLVPDIKANVITGNSTEEVFIEFDTLEFQDGDNRWSPSKKGRLNLTLKNSRLRE